MNVNLGSDLYILAWQRVGQLTNAELTGFVCSRDSLVRDMVVREFHGRPCGEVFEIAQSLIHGKKAVERETGYLILGQLGTPKRPFRNKSVPLILRGLAAEKTTSVQCAISYAIGHLSPELTFHDEIAGGLIRYLDLGKKSLRVAVAFAVSGVWTSKGWPILIRRLRSDTDLDVQDWLKISLATVRERRRQKK